MLEVRLALGIEYDGTEWSGWQSQPSRNTVQDHLEDAIEKFSLEELTNYKKSLLGYVTMVENEIDQRLKQKKEAEKFFK